MAKKRRGKTNVTVKNDKSIGERNDARFLWDRQGLGIDVAEAARHRIRYAYEEFDNIIVSFSGGKDSTACLNLTIEVAKELGRLPVHVAFFDEEAIPWETIHYVERVAALPEVELAWLCLPVRHRNACSMESPSWWPWAPEAEPLWVRPMPEQAITWDRFPGFIIEPPDARQAIPELNVHLPDLWGFRGTTGVIMGIRAGESLTRRRAVSSDRADNFVIRYNDHGRVWAKVYPVYDWTTEDIWTAPSKFGWDTNTTYDLLELAGISHFDQRCAPPYGEQPMQGLWTFKVCFPDIWPKMADRVPGAAAAARYATTSLYSFGDAPPKPSDLSWEEHIRALIEGHPEDVRGWVAGRIKGFMDRHYRQTSDPILEVQHPESAVSWPWLAKVAHRGDFKERMSLNFISAQTDKNRAAYAAALADYRREMAVAGADRTE